MKPGKSGLRRIVDAASYSAKGFRYAWKHEAAFRQEFVLCLVMVPIGFWIGTDAVEKSLLVGSCLMVLAFEMVNSSIEAVVDRIGHDHHELSGSAKDMASSAVFVALVLTVVVWGLIVYEHFGRGGA